jgi:hypothetical protein
VEQGSDPPRGDADIYALSDEKPAIVAEQLARRGPEAPPETA